MPVPAGGGSVTEPDLLATTSDLAAVLQIAEADLKTSTAQVLLETATAVVQAVTGQRIVEVVDDEVVLDADEFDGGLYLNLPQRPVTAVGAVLVGATAVTDVSSQLRRSRLYRAGGWRSANCWSSPSTVTVTYTHGYP
jgi:hypothetical protein